MSTESNPQRAEAPSRSADVEVLHFLAAPPPELETLVLTPNRDALEALTIQMQRGRRVVPFVGAGFSIACGICGWQALLTELATLSPVDDLQEKVSECLRQYAFEDAAECLYEELGRGVFDQAIDRRFGYEVSAHAPLRGPALLLPLIFDGPVLTTNFDAVLERCYAWWGRQFPDGSVVWGERAFAFQEACSRGERMLFKIHGDGRDRGQRVLTRTEYDRSYGIGVPASQTPRSLADLLTNVLRSQPLLFLGCSLNADRITAILERTATEAGAIQHFAILEMPDAPKEAASRLRFLSNRRIHPIWYPTGRHDLVPYLLSHLVGRMGKAGEVRDFARAMTRGQWKDASEAGVRLVKAQPTVQMLRRVTATASLFAAEDAFEAETPGVIPMYVGRAIEVYGADPWLLRLRAIALFGRGEFESAQADLDRLKDLGPLDGKLHHLQAILHFLNGESVKAFDHMALAVEADPDDEERWNIWISIPYMAGDKDRLVLVLEKLAKHRPDDGETRLMLRSVKLVPKFAFRAGNFTYRRISSKVLKYSMQITSQWSGNSASGDLGDTDLLRAEDFDWEPDDI